MPLKHYRACGVSIKNCRTFQRVDHYSFFLVVSISGEAGTHWSTILLYFSLASKLKLWGFCYLCSIHVFLDGWCDVEVV